MKRALLLFIPRCFALGFALGYFALGFALAQSGLTPPRVGWMLDKSNHPRPVEGVAGNFWLGSSIENEALSLSSSGPTAVLKTAPEIIVLDAQGRVASKFPAPEGPAQFAFTASGSPALVWFSQTRELAYFEGSQLRGVPVNPSALGGDVIALAEFSATRATLLVDRERAISRVSVDLRTGFVRFETGLPGLHAPAYLAPDGTILASDRDGLVVRHPNDADIHLAFPVKPEAFTSLGHSWVLAQGSQSAHYAVRVAPSREQVFQLPEARQ